MSSRDERLAHRPRTPDPRCVRPPRNLLERSPYLQKELIDELHLAIRPVLLGAGEHLLGDIDLRALGYKVAETVAGERATHMFIRWRT